MTAIQDEDRQALAEAATAAGVPLEAVERIAENYHAWLALERQGCSLNDARGGFALVRKLAPEVRRATYFRPVLTAVTDLDDRWPKAAAKLVEAMAEVEALAEEGHRSLEARAAGYTSGGKTNLVHLIADPAKVRLVRELAALLPPGTATTSVGGRLFRLVGAVHCAVTGEGERGVSHAIRSAGIARTCQEKRGSRKDTRVSL